MGFFSSLVFRVENERHGIRMLLSWHHFFRLFIIDVNGILGDIEVVTVEHLPIVNSVDGNLDIAHVKSEIILQFAMKNNIATILRVVIR